MSRYFSRPKVPRAEYDDWNPLIPALTVDNHVPVNTGLVDLRGNAILRAPETMGFHSPK